MSKKEKSIPEKLKNFFGIKETVPLNLEKCKAEPYIISNETLKDISSENSYSHRLRALKELYDAALTKKMEHYIVEAICHRTKDLLTPNNPVDCRHIVLQFYSTLIQGQREQMNMMRSCFFKLIRLHNISEDALPRFEMLKALSEDGKNVSYFEEEIGPFLLDWLISPDMISVKSTEFLPFIANVIKFNAAYIDDDVIAGIIQHTCSLCGRTKLDEDIHACLDILDAVICYHHLPASVLQSSIFALCLTVIVEKFAQFSWKLMRNLLGTNAGTTGVYKLCLILEDKKNYKDASLLRGAIFFISMALWGANKVPSLIHPPTSVLPFFFKALESGNSSVAYEIVLSCQRLVKISGRNLTTLCWDIIFDIIEKVLIYPEVQNVNQSSVLAKAAHELITAVEDNCSDKDRLFNIIESCSTVRNEESVIHLISYQAKSIKPTGKDFGTNMNRLLEKYFKNEKRRAVQLAVLKVLHSSRHLSGHLFEDDLIDQSILQYMSHLEAITDVLVRKAAVEILIEIAETCITARFFDILDIIEKVMKHLFDYPLNHNQEIDGWNKDLFLDVHVAVQGLISIFKKKLYLLPSSHCVKIYSILANHLKSHFDHMLYVDEAVKIRQLIIAFFLQFRANYQKQIGLCVDGKVGYSVYISCDSGESSDTAATSPPPGSPSFFTTVTISFLSYKEAFQCLVTSLKKEKDWTILELIFKKLPKLLQNKTLIISGNCNIISTLCVTLCTMHSDRNNGIPGTLKNTPPRFTRSDVQGHIFPSVSALTSYHSVMEPRIQRNLIQCLQAGLVSSSPKICMEGLTLCTLEMQDSIIKLIDNVLLKLSKIVAKVGVAVPVLEFLSNLIRLPRLYVSFVEDQYMSIFAIALPYTNPFKFNQYTVALAHHVIAMWFLKCRIPFRKEFANFITKGLRSNINIPREENQNIGTHSTNEDTSSMGTDSASSARNVTTNDAIVTLHTELMETGLDLMSRFTFGMSSNVPKRSQVAEFLLEKGQKSCWLVGNKVITITTSGCGTKSFKHGMCEKCYVACRDMSKTTESDSDISVEKEQVQVERRKRHRSAIHQRSSTLSGDMLVSGPHSKDDIHLHRQNFEPPDLHARRHTSYSSKVSDGAFQKFQMDQNLEHKEKDDKNCHLCSCWCTGWAEVHIRRPTGNTSWMIKIQNQLFLPSSPPDIQLSALASLVLPQVDCSGSEQSTCFQHSEEKEENLELCDSEFSNAIEEANDEGGIDILSCQKSNSPIRRTNSSPDMNTSWSSFEALNKKDQKLDQSDSFENSMECEAGVDDPLSFKASEESSESAANCERWPSRSPKPALKLDLSPNSKAAETSRTKNTLSFANTLTEKPLNHSNDSEFQAPASRSFRNRASTLSVLMSPVKPGGSEGLVKKPEISRRSGMSPSFVFLQLFHNSCSGKPTHKPLLLLQTEANNRALSVLDHTPPYDTHKIGVVYVGPGQVDNEVAILSNVGGSARYVAFLRGLGNFVKLTDVDPHTTYLDGLDTKGEDGKFALIWHDDVMQVVFHVATLMYNKESDANRNEKKKHIANDYVVIVYNESGEEYKLSAIKGHVTSACVIIQPEDISSNVVTVKLKSTELMDTFGHSESYIVSDESLPIFVRQLALHANLASLIISRRQHSNKYAHVSNWLERLRTIKRLRTKVLEEKAKSESSGFESASNDANFDNFTDYV